MGLRSALRSSIMVDESLHETIQESQDGQWSVIVRPPEKPTEDPRKTAAKLFKDIHGKYESISIEMHQTESGEIEFHAVVDDKQTAKRLRTHVRSAIDGAEVSEVVRASLPIEEGDVVSGTRIQYEDDYLLPLETAASPTDTGDDPYRAFLDTMADEHNQRAVLQLVATPVGDGWTRRWTRAPPRGILPRSRLDRWRVIPRKANVIVFMLIAVLLGGGWFTARGVVPIVSDLVSLPSILTAPLSLTVTGVFLVFFLAGLLYAAVFGSGIGIKRHSSYSFAQYIRDNEFEDGKPSRDDRRAADNVAKQGETAAYEVNARLLTISDSVGKATEYQNKLGGHIVNSYRNPSTRQELAGVEIGWLWSRRLRSFIASVAGRESTRTVWHWIHKLTFRATRRRPVFMALPEFVALAHWSGTSGGGAAAIEYATDDEGEPLPPGDEGYQSTAVEGPDPVSELTGTGEEAATEPSADETTASDPVEDDPSTEDETDVFPEPARDESLADTMSEAEDSETRASS